LDFTAASVLAILLGLLLGFFSFQSYPLNLEIRFLPITFIFIIFVRNSSFFLVLFFLYRHELKMIIYFLLSLNSYLQYYFSFSATMVNLFSSLFTTLLALIEMLIAILLIQEKEIYLAITSGLLFYAFLAVIEVFVYNIIFFSFIMPI